MKNFLNSVCRYMLSEESINEANRRFHHNKNSAARRHKENNLPFWFVCLMMKQKYCFYSGEEFGTNKADSMSFERINPDIGYEVGNVVPVKVKYNSLRSDAYLPEELQPRINSHREHADRLKLQLGNMKIQTHAISTRLDVIMLIPAGSISPKSNKNYKLEIKNKIAKRERIENSIVSVTKSYNASLTMVNDLLNLQQMISRFNRYTKPTLAMKFVTGLL